MSTGLQIFDSNGVLIVDTSTMLPRSVYIGEVTGPGTVTILPLVSGNQVGVTQIVTDGGPPPDVTLSGSTLTWSNRPNKPFYSAKLSVTLL